MEKLVISGGNRLRGEVIVSGAKNAAVAIIPAVILADVPCVLENIPNISDVIEQFHILEDMGASVIRLGKNTFRIDATNLTNRSVSYDHATKLRASYYFLGALLGKYGDACVSMPGGCSFCDRPMDQHIKAFNLLGANVDVQDGAYLISANKLTAAHINFGVISVGATINAILAAVKANGQTILTSVAKEPHIVDLANFLNSCGADIKGAGTDTIKINGVKALRGAMGDKEEISYQIIPDQIEAGTFMVAVAATGGDTLIKNVIPKHLEDITKYLRETGVLVTEYDDAIRVYTDNTPENISGEIDFLAYNKPRLKRVEKITTRPHPGFPTDMQPQFTALLTIAGGVSTVYETVWEQRFSYVDQLRRMGANIIVGGSVAVVEGTDFLMGTTVRATDLRAGAALIIAGLCAEGVTEIEEISHIERGYEDIVEKFSSLGANIFKRWYEDEAIAVNIA